jgi:hypothetical protein
MWTAAVEMSFQIIIGVWIAMDFVTRPLGDW